MDVVQERIEREYHIDLIATAPSVVYHAYLTDGSMLAIDNPSLLPDVQKIDHIEEPFVKASIMTPKEYVGAIMELCQRKRGNYTDMVYIDDTRMNLIYELPFGAVMELCQNKRGIYKDMHYIDAHRNTLEYEIPLGEIVFDFFDKLKSCTKGYASFDYELIGYQPNKLAKMDILLNGEVVDALSSIVHREFAYPRGRAICEKLKKLIPKQQFEIPIQAAINGKIIARADIKSLRKNVLAKCYGGDISRKKKLLEKQKEGKKRMKAVGSVEVPQEAFMAVLSMDDES